MSSTNTKLVFFYESQRQLITSRRRQLQGQDQRLEAETSDSKLSRTGSTAWPPQPPTISPKLSLPAFEDETVQRKGRIQSSTRRSGRRSRCVDLSPATFSPKERKS